MYGQVDANGTLYPTIDKQNQIMVSAGQPSSMDWARAIKRGDGVINDAHTNIRVGRPLALEYHDGTTALSRRDGKLGWWLWSRLYDRNDPDSWDGYTMPSPAEFARANYYWVVLQLLLASGRPGGYSIQGFSCLTPDRGSAVMTDVRHVALVEYPVNPDCTIEHVGGVVLPTVKGIATTNEDADSDRESDENERLIQKIVALTVKLRPDFATNTKVLADVLRKMLAARKGKQ